VIQDIRSTPLALIAQAIGKVADKAKELLGLTGPNANQYQGLIGKVVTFRVGTVTHRLWVVNRNGKPVIMRASQPGLFDHLKDDTPGKEAEAGAAAQQLIQDAGKGIADAARGPAGVADAAADARAAEADEQKLSRVIAPDAKYNSFFASVAIPNSVSGLPIGNDTQMLAQLRLNLTGREPVRSILVIDGRAYRLGSDGLSDPAYTTRLASSLGAEDKVPGFTSVTTKHAEGSIVALIRRLLLDNPSITSATVYMNLPPCGMAYSGNGRVQDPERCDANLEKMLPAGFTLQVVFKRAKTGNSGSKPYSGTGLS
jgi:hypothetical protein